MSSHNTQGIKKEEPNENISLFKEEPGDEGISSPQAKKRRLNSTQKENIPSVGSAQSPTTPNKKYIQKVGDSRQIKNEDDIEDAQKQKTGPVPPKMEAPDDFKTSDPEAGPSAEDLAHRRRKEIELLNEYLAEATRSLNYSKIFAEQYKQREEILCGMIERKQQGQPKAAEQEKDARIKAEEGDKNNEDFISDDIEVLKGHLEAAKRNNLYNLEEVEKGEKKISTYKRLIEEQSA